MHCCIIGCFRAALFWSFRSSPPHQPWRRVFRSCVSLSTSSEVGSDTSADKRAEVGSRRSKGSSPPQEVLQKMMRRGTNVSAPVSESQGLKVMVVGMLLPRRIGFCFAKREVNSYICLIACPRKGSHKCRKMSSQTQIFRQDAVCDIFGI